eukprot:6183117-Pleurochrysis_carterae.AAC.1
MHQERAKDKARRLPYTVHSYHRCEAHRGNTGVCYVCVTSLKHWQLLTQMWYRTDVLLGDRRHNEGMRVAEAMPTTASRNTCTRLEGRLRNMRVADPTRRRRLASCEELRLPVGIQPQRMKNSRLKRASSASVKGDELLGRWCVWAIGSCGRFRGVCGSRHQRRARLSRSLLCH